MAGLTVAERLLEVRERIADAERRFGREPGSVSLLAVSKRHDQALIREAAARGQRAFGESYVQEALGKLPVLADLDLSWHFIGRIQTNKTRVIAEHFDWVHGLTDERHARRLDAQRPPGLAPLSACIQVNLSGEPSKAGVAPDALAAMLAACRGLSRVRMVGLMCLPAPSPDFDTQRRAFADLRELRDRLADPELPLSTLSMGMSADLEAAIAEGATIVRIGTAVFGARES